MKQNYFRHIILCLCLLAVTTTAFAYDAEIDGIYYNFSGDEAIVTRGWSYSGTVTIPSTVTYYGTTYSVTSIGHEAFRDCISLASVTIPNSVTSIGGYAFQFCTSLTSVTIPNSVTCIGEAAFAYCYGLTSVTIPESVTSIGDYAFSNCEGLTSVHITDLAAWCGIAFGSYDANPLNYAHHLFVNGEEITDLVIPDGVTSIGNFAFEFCSGLTSVTIPNSVTFIGGGAFSGCSGLTSVTIPNSVTSIGDVAFHGTAWYDNQPDGLVYAGKVAYCYKGTMPEGTEIVIKDGTLGIAGSAFYNCSGLTSVTIPNSVTSIGERAFYACSGLTSVTIGNSVTSIGESAFESCRNLTSVTIPNSVTSIGDLVFRECSGLTSVTIPNSVTSIGSNPFFGCSGLTSIIVEEGNTVYDSRDNCNAIIETESNTLICGCQNTIIPNSVTSIGFGAFCGCSGLTSVTIPNSVTSIDWYAFSGCNSLTDVYCLAEEVPETESSAFWQTSIESATLYVPAASLEAYKSTEPWSGFGTIVGLTEDEIDGIGLTPAVSKGEEDWFTLDGKKLIKPQRGINIIRYSNGTTRKVLER